MGRDLSHERIPDPVPSPSLPEVEFSDITVNQQIGAGAYTEVHLAEVTVNGEAIEVAVVEPDVVGTLTQEEIQSFRDRVEIWDALDDHEHIVTVHDWGTFPLPWVAVEYMDGGSLAERTGQSSVAEGLWLAGRIAEGLRCGHRHGVAHLHLTPSNVLFRETPPGNWDYPKISDWEFGTPLKGTADPVDELPLTQAAPEQLEPDEYGSPDNRTDIYQLGTLLYTLLAGEPPFSGSTAETTQRVLEAEPAPPSAVNPSVPEAVDTAVMKALAKQKNERYDAVLTFRDTIDELFQQHVDETSGSTSGDSEPATTAVEGNQTVTAEGASTSDEEDIAATVAAIRERFHSEDEAERKQATQDLIELGEEQPDELRSEVDTLRELLDREENLARLAAAAALKGVAVAHPDAVRQTVPALESLLTDEADPVRGAAAGALGYVADTYPEGVRAAVDDIKPLLTNDMDIVRADAANALAAIASEFPDDIQSVADDIKRLLIDDHEPARVSAAKALSQLADAHPEAVRSAVDDLRNLLNHEADAARGAAARALARVGNAYPGDIEPAVTDLEGRLDDEYGPARGWAASALAQVAAEHPETVRPTVTALRACLDDEYTHVQTNAALALKRIGEADPAAIESAASDFEALLDADHPRLCGRAAGALAEVARTDADAVRPAVDGLSELLDHDDEIVRADAARALSRVASEHPGDVRGAVPDLRALLDDESARGWALHALGTVAMEHPGSVRPATEDIRELLTANDEPVREEATAGLRWVAAEHPDAVRPAVDDLKSCLDDEADRVRLWAARALREVADEYPGAVRSTTEELRACLDDELVETRQAAVWTLKRVAVEHPDAVQPMVGEFEPLLHDDEADVRGLTAGALEAVAAEYPEALRPVVTDLEELLDDEELRVRRDAARALRTGAEGAPAVVQPAQDGLQRATTDDEESVAEAATEALAALNGAEGPATEESEDKSGAESGPMDIPDSETMVSPPRRSLSYEDLTIKSQLGRGGQAIVHDTHLPDGEPERVALKEPLQPKTLTPEAVEEFQQKAEIWATIDAREREKRRWADCEHVVGVIDIGDELPWIATEYMDGGSLAERLEAHPDGLPVDEALWFGERICYGVAVAHSLGIAHLDLKPENVLLAETEEGPPWPKIADWGLARTLAERSGSMEALSVEYAAPEQFDAGEFGDPDELTDIYQLGVLVYALLTGDPPTTGSQLEVLQTTIGEEPIPAPSDRRPGLAPEIDAALGIALERDKTTRYESVTEFRRALRAVRTGDRLPIQVAERV